MKYVLIFISFVFLKSVNSIKPPVSIVDSYESSLGFGDLSVGWNLIANAGNSYPSSNNAPPLNQYSPEEPPLEQPVGIESNKDVKSGSKKEDTCVLLHRQPEECLRATNFTDSKFSCLKYPNSCEASWSPGDLSPKNNQPVTGLSFSLWVNLPNSFYTKPEYILDTGGRLEGDAGISIYHTPSLDAQRYSQQIIVVISTGKQVWEGVINGLLSSHYWNNLGIRWSQDLDNNGTPLGLQIFVNRTRIFWRRSPFDVGGGQGNRSHPIQLSLGCMLDGSKPLSGRIDQPSFWFWWLKDDQIEFFDGSLTFKTPVIKVDYTPFDSNERNHISITSVYFSGLFVPWEYEMAVLNATVHDYKENWLDDTTSAEGVICDPTMVAGSWGYSPYYARQKISHPIDCAVTVSQLIAAMSYQSPFTGEALVRAIVRVGNKAGPDGLSPQDINVLMSKPYTTVIQMLNSETSIDVLQEGKFYGNLAFLLSKIQERDIYGPHWARAQNMGSNNTTANGTAGTDITLLLRLFNDFFIALAKKLERKDNVLIESNNTVTSFSKVRKSDVTSGMLFPDYELTVQSEDFDREDPFYTFPTERAESWGHVNDHLSLSVPYFAAYDDPYQELIMVTYLNNQIGLILPPNFDDRITGADMDTTVFYTNSRVISVEIIPESENSSKYLQLYPTQIFLEHKKRQPEQAFKKGAMICVYWVMNQREEEFGAWDSGNCNVTFSNDTHTHCSCAQLGHFAILAEEYTPGGPGDAGYYFCDLIYLISIILLVVGMTVIINKKRLHSEIHIMIMNQYFCLICAFICYIITQLGEPSRLHCLFLSSCMHYFYTAFSIWTFYHCEKIRKALKKHCMNGGMGTVCVVGYGLPALLVSICSFIEPETYGVGYRCLAHRNDFTIWIWIGIILAISVLSIIQLIFAGMNMTQKVFLDPEDALDIRFSLIGCAVVTSMHMFVWFFVIIVHINVSGSPINDFFLEILNSFLGITTFVFLSVLIPSSRHNLLCKRDKLDAWGKSWIFRRKLRTRVYYEERVKIQRLKDLEDSEEDDD